MTVETLLLAATTLTALVAVVVAVVAVRAVRRLERHASHSVAEVATQPAAAEVATQSPPTTDLVPVESAPEGATRLQARVVQGRVVVPPTQAQVVRTALGRPGVRLNVFVHGLARALRPENRDRIVSLMRREYRHRRRERLRAGRQAVRMARPASAPSTERMHERLLEPKPLSLTERMIGS